MIQAPTLREYSRGYGEETYALSPVSTHHRAREKPKDNSKQTQMLSLVGLNIGVSKTLLIGPVGAYMRMCCCEGYGFQAG